MLDDVPTSGSFLELATQLQPGTGPCLDGDGKIQNGCFVVAYIVYMLMHGFVSLKQTHAEQKARDNPPLPAVTMDTVQRMEAECTFWWQPPPWWEQQPMWMSVPPRWLNDVEVRDDSALLQLAEAGVDPLDAAQRGVATASHTSAGEAAAAAATTGPAPDSAAAAWSEEQVAEARALQAELAETHTTLSQQQQLLTLDHHLVWKLKGLLGRLEGASVPTNGT